ncbi:MAG TPA: MFS transporter [Acidimicrobiales bacterium]
MDDEGAGEEVEGGPEDGTGRILAAFHYRNFSLVWSAALLSSTGSYLQSLTVPVVVYQITGSGLWLGLAGFLAFFPMVFVAPLAGTLSDRFSRRSMLLVVSCAQFVITTILWLVWVAGWRSIGVILVLLTVSAIAGGFQAPTFQAFVSELVPRRHLLNAVTLISAQFNAARAFGPALGGIVLATLGPSWCFFLNALTFLVQALALGFVRLAPRIRAALDGRPRVVAEMMDAVRYVRTEPGILGCLFLVFAIGMLGGPIAQLLVVFTEDVFGVSDAAYGLLAACNGTGAILAVPIIAGPGTRLPRSTLITAAAFTLGTCVIVLGISPNIWVAGVALLFYGAAYFGMGSGLQTIIQMQVTEAMRGKAMALYVMVLTLGMPIGTLLEGWLVDVIGVQATVAGSGVLYLAFFTYLRFRTGLTAAMDDLSRGALSEEDRLAVAETQAAEAAVDPI